jgi:hypothetical protein
MKKIAMLGDILTYNKDKDIWVYFSILGCDGAAM